MKVKICGITDLKTAKCAINAGADAIGFVFAESKRQIEVSEAKKIIESLPDSVLKIGVFVNETKETLESIYEEVGLTHLQLHGDETPEFCRSLSFPVIKALRVQSEKDVEKIAEYDCDYILVDSPSGKYRGGNGTTFNWGLVKSRKTDNLILAGGLTIENVIHATSLVKPIMVDVSSGVETNGKKDEEKIKSFIKKVKLGGI
ncbi:phosphoribosylanthranilate isomerase [Bacillus sp. AFS088145]|uniref:phosphoribosylanthranilate isomerase n=1 Tax=Bacillus sp. AFS088145 TaxID=2033514 RepID=UPI000BF9F778|nr:phosphoribosylanthranilate isomerase [Bacillus sp. AFS088145]PFH85666.1 phosphoribosylanthranilate isomerase [Bacillus sp. AFS088145]